MEIKTNYIINEKGSKEYVVIPYKCWEDIQKLICKYEVLEEIREDFIEAKNSERVDNPLQTLTKALNECLDKIK